MRSLLGTAVAFAMASAVAPIATASPTPLAPEQALPVARGAAAPAPCRALEPTKRLRRKLRRVHVRALRRNTDSQSVRVRGPLGRVYYGRCGSTRFAVATFAHRIGGTRFGTQDQPERFRRRAGRSWRDVGDTGGLVCGTMPRRLLEAWGFDCSDQRAATAARKNCGRVRHRGHSYKVVVQRGRVSCRGARRIVSRWARALPTPGWMCFLAHGDDVTYGAVCAPAGQDPDFARRRILIY